MPNLTQRLIDAAQELATAYPEHHAAILINRIMHIEEVSPIIQNKLKDAMYRKFGKNGGPFEFKKHHWQGNNYVQCIDQTTGAWIVGRVENSRLYIHIDSTKNEPMAVAKATQDNVPQDIKLKLRFCMMRKLGASSPYEYTKIDDKTYKIASKIDGRSLTYKTVGKRLKLVGQYNTEI